MTLVGELKQEIARVAEAQDKFIRLIHQGKLLSDDQASVESVKLAPNDFVHCAMSAMAPRVIQTPVPRKNDGAEDEEDDIEEGNRRGFDRLREFMSREEVQALRIHFYPQIATVVAQSTPREGETTEERIYRIEEEWMNAQGPLSEFALNVRPRMVGNAATEYRIEMPADAASFSLMHAETEGTYFDMAWGMLMGVLLGFILLFWLWERSVPRRQKLGIVMGVCLNIVISIMPRHIPE